MKILFLIMICSLLYGQTVEHFESVKYNDKILWNLTRVTDGDVVTIYHKNVKLPRSYIIEDCKDLYGQNCLVKSDVLRPVENIFNK